MLVDRIQEPFASDRPPQIAIFHTDLSLNTGGAFNDPDNKFALLYKDAFCQGVQKRGHGTAILT